MQAKGNNQINITGLHLSRSCNKLNSYQVISGLEFTMLTKHVTLMKQNVVKA